MSRLELYINGQLVENVRMDFVGAKPLDNDLLVQTSIDRIKRENTLRMKDQEWELFIVHPSKGK